MVDGGRPLRVLCLEDSPPDAERMHETLTRAGYQVDVALAPDRRRFEELLAGESYNIILADFALPGFDAHAALELAKAACPTTPFICVSGVIGEEATVELLKQGADDCVLKDRMARLPFAVQRAIDEAARRRELNEAEAALRESQERERFALRGTNDGLWDVRMDTGAVYLSPRGCEILGYSPEEMATVAETWDQLVCPDDRPATDAALGAYLEGGIGGRAVVRTDQLIPGFRDRRHLLRAVTEDLAAARAEVHRAGVHPHVPQAVVRAPQGEALAFLALSQGGLGLVELSPTGRLVDGALHGEGQARHAVFE